MSNDYIAFTIGKKKDIALIAYDNEKSKLIEWCREHYGVLKQYNLYGTGTTARMTTNKTDLTVKGYNSGPLGGDQQIGAKITEGAISFVVFFSDLPTAQPHDPDVKASVRTAQVYGAPMATNKVTVDFMITSMSMEGEYEHDVTNFRKNIKERAENMQDWKQFPISQAESAILSLINTTGLGETYLQKLWPLFYNPSYVYRFIT